MAYAHATTAPRATKLSALTGRNMRGLLCYAGFALSFGFAAAIVFGLVH